MRIERTGKVDPLTPRVVRFLTEGLGGRPIDDVESPEQRRADYACLRGLIAVELKTLEEDGSERMDHVIDALQKRGDWPYFLGPAPLDSVIKNMAEPDRIRFQLTDRAGRAIVRHVKKANGQLEAHSRRFPRKNQVRLIILVNEDHELYEPYLVAYVASRILVRKESDTFRYPFIDGFLFLTERHAQPIEGHLGFPVVLLGGAGIADAPWKIDVLKRVTDAWPAWNQKPCFTGAGDIQQFTTIADIPDTMSRDETWWLEYRRYPYMQGLTTEQLRDRFDNIVLQTHLFGIKGSPVKLSREQSTEVFRRSAHITIEMGVRGIPATQFPYSLDRMTAAAKRLNLPEAVFNWLVELDRARNAA